MVVMFQTACAVERVDASSPVSLDTFIGNQGTDWTVVYSKLLPYGTKSFDGLSKGTIKYGAGMMLYRDGRVENDIFYGILLDTEYASEDHCVGHCGYKNKEAYCWCDEECSHYGDCCYDVCPSCFMSCDGDTESGCRNSCVYVANSDRATCHTWGYNFFELGDTCTLGECGIKCTITEEHMGKSPSLEGTLECTLRGMECTDDSLYGCYCDACLASSSTVTILSDSSRELVRVDELKIGDKVMAFDDAGNLIFDEIYYIYHDIPWTGSNDILHFVNIGHAGGSVRLTSFHLIYLTKANGQASAKCIQIQNNIACTFAANIAEIGDTIWVKNDDDVLEPQIITSLSVVSDKNRSPLTVNGNIIVDNVAVSVYSENHAHDEAGSLPLRIINYFESLRWIMETGVFKFSWEKYFALRSEDILWESEIVTSMTALGASDASTLAAVVLVYLGFSMVMLWK